MSAELIATHIFDPELHSGRFGETGPVLPDRYRNEKELKGPGNAHEALESAGNAETTQS